MGMEIPAETPRRRRNEAQEAWRTLCKSALKELWWKGTRLHEGGEPSPGGRIRCPFSRLRAWAIPC